MKYLKVIGIVFISLFLIFAFIHADMNISNWDIQTRFFIGIFGTIVSLIVSGYLSLKNS